MVQSLLEDRFKLVTHRDRREMPLQALVRAKPDGPLGPRISPVDDCNAAKVTEVRRQFSQQHPSSTMAGCSRAGLSALADLLTIGLDTPVVDDTALTGSFYFNVSSQFRPLPFQLGGTAVADSNLPALPTALQEQLGLKLESRRSPVEVLVIDSVQQPTED